MLVQCVLVVVVLLVVVAVTARPGRLLRLHGLIKVDFPYIPLIGHAYKFIGSNEDRMLMFDELARQAYRNKHGLASVWLAHYLCVSVSEPAAARLVLQNFCDKWPVTLPMRHLLGNGSVFAEEEIWRRRRKILVPVFNSKYCDNFVKIFERNNKIMMERLASVVNKGDFSMWEYFSAYTLDSAFDMTFGENLEVQKNPNHPFSVAFQDYFRNCAARVCQPWLFSNVIYELLPVGGRQNRNKKLIWDCIENLVKKGKMLFREQLENTATRDTKNGEHEQFKSFLHLLIQFSGGEAGYSDTELREESLVLILAGTDTSATTSCLASVLLANHPDVQHKLYQEIQEVLGNSEKSLNNLAKLKYLDAVVKETMRLYPPAPVTVRRCNRDLELASGVVLPGGCYVLLNTWGVHRNPRVWGADATHFRPERFLSATPEQLAAFMPFGHGPRSCTGSHLAVTSIKMSLVEVVRRYRITPATTYECSAQKPLRVTFDIMLKHVHKFTVQLEERH